MARLPQLEASIPDGAVCLVRRLRPNLTNAEFARTDARFRLACAALGVEPTKRAAAKYRRGIGPVAAHDTPANIRAGRFFRGN